MSGDGLNTPREKDMAALRSTGRTRYSLVLIKSLGAFLGLLFGALITLYAVHQYRGDDIDANQIERQLLSLQTRWADDFADSQQAYRIWLSQHATRTEAIIFDDASVILAQSALSVAASSEGRDGELTFLSGLYVTLHGGLLRLLFLMLASFRAWVVVSLIAVWWAIHALKPYDGDDVLGQTGNGRMFYSGILADLEKVTPDGAPDVLVRGLACPKVATLVEARSSHLWQLLNEYGAVNATNEVLTAILVKNGTTASYVSLPDEELMLANTFSGYTLEENAAQLLSSALTLHGVYSAGDTKAAGLLSEGNSPQHTGGGLSSEQYADLVKSAMHRVLTPEMRHIIGSLPATEIATLVLAFECGKVLAHSYEGGRWIRRSNFPQLSARAVLHSVTEYPKDYDFDSRMRIRRALIYASRRSAFAPVRMPLDLTEDIWTVRQWMELLTACPHELSAVSDEVEMAGLMRTAHHKWIQEFLDGSVAFTPDIAKNSFSTPSNLLFVPLSRAITLLRKTLEPAQIRRLEQLVAVVSTRQRLQQLEAQNLEQGGSEVPVVERVYSPITEEETTELCQMHGLAPDELRDWSALRVVLTSYGWLARRVGDYTVPESSVIFTVFRADSSFKDANDLGLLGRSGMVPFRGSKLEDRWGRNWSQRFMLVSKATMSESREDFEKLLRGIDDGEADDLPENLTPVTA